MDGINELVLLSFAYAGFIGLIGAEVLVSALQKRGYYTFKEACTNIAHGVAYQLFDLFTKSLLMVPFLALRAIAPATLPMDAWWSWAIALLAYDFASYWNHRIHHQVGFLWAIHGVHHAAEEFNLAAALRQPLFQGIFGWIPKLPLALFMPIEMFIGVIVIDFLYQFLQHTRFVRSVGPFEWVMNTPSHHRVHHGTEAQYLDKNYGGIFIIWDRLFGTFEPEDAPVTYGVTKPIASLNPVWGNFHFFAELARAAARVEGPANKMKTWLVGPGALEALAGPDLAPAGLRASAIATQAPPTKTAAYIHIGLSLAAATAALTMLIMAAAALSTIATVALAAFVVASLFAIGGAAEHRPWMPLVVAVQLASAGAAIFGALA